MTGIEAGMICVGVVMVVTNVMAMIWGPKPHELAVLRMKMFESDLKAIANEFTQDEASRETKT